MTRVVVVGAGLAGVACARVLRAGGADVTVLDRGRVVGGRMASRSLWDRRADLGASYFTVADPGFRAVVDDWARRGLAREWTDTFTVIGAGEPEDKQGPVRWGAAGGLRSLVEDLASDLDVERREVAGLAELGADADVVVLAMPDPQARRVLGDHPAAARLDRQWEPALAIAARWPARTWDDTSPGGHFDGAFVDDPVLAWIADDGRRRDDGAPVLVAHSTPGFARRHLDTPPAAVPELVASLRALLGVDEPADTWVHRWTHAKPSGSRDAPWLLHEGDGPVVGVCGDGWGPTSKVETAWLSGTGLGQEVAQRIR